MVQGLVLLVNPAADVLDPWKTTLVLYAFILLAVGFNIFCAQHLPLAEGWLDYPCDPADKIFTDKSRRTPLRPRLRLLCLFTYFLDHGGARTGIKSFHRISVCGDPLCMSVS